MIYFYILSVSVNFLILNNYFLFHINLRENCQHQNELSEDRVPKNPPSEGVHRLSSSSTDNSEEGNSSIVRISNKLC